ncbi:hypothetical protein ACH5RR_028098 [Cinchona calisaya]|uniref:Uncharacterized protein n=1 Tax=Cinchona calisaya TaxID=153742 RepID=A0ABD2YS82_9GENT
MEQQHQRKKTISGDKFSFPIIPIVQDNHHDFDQFGNCVTPCSPNSTADRLFFNGKLLPHSFPYQTTTYNISCFSRSTSRTSSISSKDSSSMSSRSNSTNSSRSSSCSSARTSTRSVACAASTKVAAQNTFEKDLHKARKKPVLMSTPHYGSSQRWQFIAPAPPLKHHQVVSRARKASQRFEKDGKEFESKKQIARTWFGLKLFRTLVSTCKECHAMKPSATKCLDKK